MDFAAVMERPSAAAAQRLSTPPRKRVPPGSNPGATTKGGFWTFILLCVLMGIGMRQLRPSYAQGLAAPNQPRFALSANLPAQPPPWLADLLAKARQVEDQLQQPNQQFSAPSRGSTDNSAANPEPAMASPVNLVHELTGVMPSPSSMTYATAFSVWVTEEVLRPSFLTLAALLPLASGLYLLNRRALAAIFRVTLSCLVLLVSGVVTTRQLVYPWFLRLMPTGLSAQAPLFVALGCVMTLGAHVLGAKMWMARESSSGPSATSTSAHTNELPLTFFPKPENSKVLNGQSACVVEPTESTPPADQTRRLRLL